MFANLTQSSFELNAPFVIKTETPSFVRGACTKRSPPHRHLISLRAVWRTWPNRYDLGSPVEKEWEGVAQVE